MLLSVSRKTSLPQTLATISSRVTISSLVLKQQNKYLQRDTLQLQHMPATAQPTRTKIELEVFAEPDRLLELQWAGRPCDTAFRGS